MRLRFRIPMAVAVSLFTACVAGCAKPANQTKQPAVPAATESSPSSAARTEELEQKAAGYEDRMREIQASDMTAEEKAQAASELIDAQQKTIQEAESAGPGENPN
jgi:hypothetical protein